jgi:hypothetical protein
VDQRAKTVQQQFSGSPLRYEALLVDRLKYIGQPQSMGADQRDHSILTFDFYLLFDSQSALGYFKLP